MRPASCGLATMESDNAIPCRIGRVVEADINLRGGSGRIGRARGRGRFRSCGNFSLCEVKGTGGGTHRPRDARISVRRRRLPTIRGGPARPRLSGRYRRHRRLINSRPYPELNRWISSRTQLRQVTDRGSSLRDRVSDASRRRQRTLSPKLLLSALAEGLARSLPILNASTEMHSSANRIRLSYPSARGMFEACQCGIHARATTEDKYHGKTDRDGPHGGPPIRLQSTRCARAEQRFRQLTSAGFTAAVRTGPGEISRIKSFDPTAEETLFFPQLVGG